MDRSPICPFLLLRTLRNFAASPSDSFPPVSSFIDAIPQKKGVVTKKKYKPVAQKVRSVVADLPEKYRIVREIMGDPLADMPVLDPNPPPFQPTGRYTAERRDILDQKHEDFLWPKS
jgi:hypothetical protein